MFGVPGQWGAKLGNFELGGGEAHVCYSLPKTEIPSGNRSDYTPPGS